MEAAGLDATLVAHYDKSVYSLEPDEFVYEFLVERCGAREVVVGEDFRFGAATPARSTPCAPSDANTASTS